MKGQELMNIPAESKADLHVHSKFSDRPSQWWLRRIGAPECFVEPRELYERLRARGMDYVTITDHNCIAGALQIADLPNTFLSCEVTTYFPDSGTKIHCLVWGIAERQFADIEEIRENIYDLQRYLLDNDIVCAVAHPLFRINDRLSVEELEKLLLMFNRFELINGGRDAYAVRLASVLLRQLTPELIWQMADRHGITPVGPTPWEKSFTAGSDDHSGLYGAAAYTVTPYAADVNHFLNCLRRGEHEPRGTPGDTLRLSRSLYQIAYSYYKAKFHVRENGRPNALRLLFERLLGDSRDRRQQVPPSGRSRFRMWFANAFSRRNRKMNVAEEVLLEEFVTLSRTNKIVTDLPVEEQDQETFRIVSRLCNAITSGVLRHLEAHIRRGNVLGCLESIASLGFVALGCAPYLTSFHVHHKDDDFYRRVIEHFDLPTDHPHCGGKAWISDTYGDANGVCRTIRSLSAVAHQLGKPFTLVTCLPEAPREPVPVMNFQPIDCIQLPEYESIELRVPSFLEVIRYVEERMFSELIISTPGPLGLVALAAARLLGIRTTGIYHTDFPLQILHLTDDDSMAELAWQYMIWFFGQMDRILVPSEYYRRRLIDRGFNPGKLSLLGRGVDLQVFHPSKRDESFWRRRGLPQGFTFLYVGRVSADKNVEYLLESFLSLLEEGNFANLAIVGDGPSRKVLQRRFAHPRICFTGFLEGEELSAAYASADAFVFPSTTDTFGNAVLEAQASGLPAIVTSEGGPAEIVRSCDSGLVIDVHKSGALQEAMKRLLTDHRLSAELGQRALHNAQQRSWSEIFKVLWGETDEATPTSVSRVNEFSQFSGLTHQVSEG